MQAQQKIWFITGVSGGFGRALAEEAAKKGDIVIGTLRKTEQLAEFEKLVPGKTFAVKMDVTHADEIQQGVEDVLNRFDHIDVLVNNAGYGLFGAVEEVTMEESRAQMETNFFGPLELTKAFLPSMRKRKSGHIIQISSMAGIRSTPGLGIYNASKHALEGFTEALYHEVKPLGIKVTIIEPGPFRTDWAGSSSVTAKTEIKDYSETAGVRVRTIHGYSGRQPGDPVKAADAIIAIANTDNPPLRLPLGKDAITAVREKLQWVEKEINDWEELSLNTAYDSK
jgi:NAD(P)-dependent dehydrogenase (short-subunit alcohol dehydrogenase family)